MVKIQVVGHVIFKFYNYYFSLGSPYCLSWLLSPVVSKLVSFLQTNQRLGSSRSGYGMTESTVQFSRSVMSDSLRPHGLQHTRPPCLSPTPLTQTHVHWVSDAIQPAHHLSSPSPPALNLSQHQGLFKWVSTSHQVAKVIFRTYFL